MQVRQGVDRDLEVGKVLLVALLPLAPPLLVSSECFRGVHRDSAA